MVLRRGDEKLRRSCEKCKRMFVPSTKSNKLCPRCRKVSNHIQKWLEISKENMSQETKRHQKIIKMNKVEKKIDNNEK
jgi:DNA-directed RNA polymerase subunit M/transcription elongation factor TFIIS